MAINFVINDPVNNDQTAGLQVGGPDPGGTDDTDVLRNTLPAAFHDRLFDALELNLATAFVDDVGAATKLNSVTVSSDGELTGLRFTGEVNDNGTPLDPDDDFAEELAVFTGANFGDGGATGLKTLDDNDILLYRDADAGLGDQMVLGIEDTTGDVVFAVYMVTNFNADGSEATVDFHQVTFEPILHPVSGDSAAAHDDEVNLGDFLTISASESIVFDFEGTPAGKNLFTMIRADGVAMVVTPDSEVIELNTSQGNTSLGLPTTLAYGNNWIENGETLVFTFVNDPVDNFTVPNLDQNEADLEPNIQFNGGLETITGGSVIIGTVGGGPAPSGTLAAFDTNAETTGDGFINGFGDDDLVAITFVRVLNASGTELFAGNASGSGGGVTVTFNGDGTVTFADFGAGYVLEYDAGDHQRISFTGGDGKFRLSGIGVDQAGAAFAAVGQNVVTDDDGPTAALARSTTEVLHDETPGVDAGSDDQLLAALPAAFAALGTAIGWAESAASVVDTTGTSFGTDGAGGTTLSLDVPADNADSGFRDLGGHAILLNTEAVTVGLDDIELIVGRVDDDDDGSVDNTDAVGIAISIDQDGILSVAQYVPFFHTDPTDPDDVEIMNNEALLAVLDVDDADEDTDQATQAIGNAVQVRDDGPDAVAPATEGVEEDDLGQIAAHLSTGNNEDASVGAHTATIDLDAGSEIFAGVDEPVSFNLFDIDPNGVLPVLFSKGDQLTYELSLDEGASGEFDVIRAYANFGTLDQRLVFTFTLEDEGDGNGNATLALNDQLDHATATSSGNGGVVDGNEEFLLQSEDEFGAPIAIDEIVFDDMLELRDADRDLVSLPAGFVSYEVQDDVPLITAQIESGTVDFELGDSMTRSLNGSVGTDENDDNNESSSGTKTYTFDSFDIVSTSIAGLTGAIVDNDTRVVFFTDEEGGTAGVFDDGIDTLWFDNVLDQTANDGAGSYTFTVQEPPPLVFTQFSFAGFPSGQQIFGVFAAETDPDSDGNALLVIPEGIALKADGSRDASASTSLNSSSAAETTLGVSSQMVNPGQAMFFISINDPEPDSIVVGDPTFDSQSYKDGDNLGFNGTVEASTASVEISQMQPNNALADVEITAYDIDPGTVGNGTVDTENNAFLEDPTATDALVNITAIRVFDGVNPDPIEVWEDSDLDGTYELVVNDPTVDVQFTETAPGSGIFTATVLNVGTNFDIEFDMENPADVWRVANVDDSDKFDIGGFNVFQGQDTPDQQFDFSVLITDFDEDTDGGETVELANFTVNVDGTGEFDDGEHEDGSLLIA